MERRETKSKNRQKLWVKMLMGISLPVILILAIAGFTIMSSVNKSVSGIVKNNLTSDSMYLSKQVSSFLADYISTSQTGAGTSEIINYIIDTKPGEKFADKPQWSQIRTSLINYTVIDPDNILRVWIADFDSSQIIASDDIVTDETFDVTSRPWYVVNELRRPVVVPPYKDTAVDSLVITVASPVIDPKTDKVAGAFAYDIQIGQLSQVLSQFKLGESGFIMLIDENGNIIYHPQEEYVQKNISDTDISSELITSVSSGTFGPVEYEMNGEKYVGDTSAVEGSQWVVITGITEDEAYSTNANIRNIILGLFAAGILFVIAAIVFMSKNITKSVNRLSYAASQIAEGNLDVEIKADSDDEIGEVAEALGDTVVRLKSYIHYIEEITEVLNQIAVGRLQFDLRQEYAGEFSTIKEALFDIRDTLSQTIYEIKEVATQVNSNSMQLSTGSQILAQGTTEQASSIEELSSTISDVASKIDDNAKHTVKANESMVKASQRISESNRQMQEMVEAMNEINARSTEIGTIIKAIDDIAFQTNILALNAAVEAARSGAAGKGFAVVADEVRNLAAKSSEAAKNSAHLIERSMKAVEEGSSLADEAAANLQALYENTGQITSTITDIANASQEHAFAVSQINQGLEQIASVVHTNAATAEESAASSKELSNQAELLQNLVDKFEI